MIAVFDIGKTNKKLFVFDEDYNVAFETSVQLEETVDEDGDPCENIDALTQWILNAFNDVLSRPQLHIQAINFSTYGASFVHLGPDGFPCAPLYNYLKPFPEDLKSTFYHTYGGENELAVATASPVLGSLNSGMILYLLKHRKPGVFRKIRQSLHLPQYVSSLFTSAYCSDLTSVGCHTNLWDFRANAYHRWTIEEGVEPKLAPIRHSDSAIQIDVQANKLYSGIGLHDSSAALIPYLLHSDEPFILLSTGTWSISLNPFNDSPLTVDELHRDCLCYLTYQGKAVKASRLFLGHIHDEKCRELSKRFGVGEAAYKKAEFMSDPGSNPRSFDEAYNTLVRDLVNQQIRSTNLVMQASIKTIYVDGGFSRNKIFMTLLSRAYPMMKIFASSVTQASALGAALVIHDDWNSKPIRKGLLKLTAFHNNADTR